jgi:hypothetical protein
MRLQEAQSKEILALLKELSQGDVIRHWDRIDQRSEYTCPFCEPDNDEHQPTCLVRRAQQFLKSLEHG